MRVRIISKSKPFYASVILTPSARNCAKKGRFIDHCCGKPLIAGAGEGNRTLVVSLGSFCSTIELHPRMPFRMPSGRSRRQVSIGTEKSNARVTRTTAHEGGADDLTRLCRAH